jgi:enoyl-[acyl-carrier-protein] reductase (NADH)
MSDRSGKHGLIVGVANKRSISWAVADLAVTLDREFGGLDLFPHGAAFAPAAERWRQHSYADLPPGSPASRNVLQVMVDAGFSRQRRHLVG